MRGGKKNTGKTVLFVSILLHVDPSKTNEKFFQHCQGNNPNRNAGCFKSLTQVMSDTSAWWQRTQALQFGCSPQIWSFLMILAFKVSFTSALSQSILRGPEESEQGLARLAASLLAVTISVQEGAWCYEKPLGQRETQCICRVSQ